MAAKKKPEKTSVSSNTQAKAAHGAKSELVRSLPTTMSAKDVVAKAKELGLALSEAYIYKIRSGAKNSTPRAPASRSHDSKALAVAPGTRTATDLVRTLPAGTSAKQAVELAKKAGIPLTIGYYYTLRSTLKLAGKGKGLSRNASGRTGAGALGLKLTSGNPHEQAVLDAVEALGPARVKAVVESAERVNSRP